MDDSRTDVEDVVCELLATSPTLFLSTTAADRPWCSGAFFVHSDPFVLSILLAPHGSTFDNLRQTQRAAFLVSSGSPFDPFLQGAGGATIIDDQIDVQAIADAMLAKSPQIEPFLGGPMVAVRLEVTSWRATDTNRGWLPGRELVPR